MRKPIKDLENLYEVDEFGNIYSLPKIKKTPTTEFLSKEKILKPYKNCWGYMLVDMRKDGKRYLKCVHRLVAEAFIPNPNNLPQVNHIDGNKLNNKIENLEWTTNAKNTQHGYDNNLYKNRSRKHSVVAINKITGEQFEFNSIRSCADNLGLNRKTITAILKEQKTNNYS